MLLTLVTYSNSTAECYQLTMVTLQCTTKVATAIHRNTPEFQQCGPDPRLGVTIGSWERCHWIPRVGLPISVQ